MKRGGLLLIAAGFAIATMISLSAAFGRPGYFNENNSRHYGWHHGCYGNRDHDDRYYNERKDPEQQKAQQDSATGKY